MTLPAPRLLALSAALALGGCAVGPAPTESVGAIRSAAKSQESVVDVLPLGDSESAAGLREARALERDGKPRAAQRALDDALRLTPDDPQLLQLRAELKLQRGDYRGAMGDATRAYQVGPQLGELCARSWRTTAAARKALRDAPGAVAAMERAEGCSLMARPRL